MAAYVALLALSVLPAISPMAAVRWVAAAIRSAGADYVRDGWVEFAMNVAMFIPLTGLLVLSIRVRPVVALFVGCALSAAIELTQMVLPSRVASGRDIVANVLGAAIGYLVGRLLLRSVAKRSSAID